MMKTVSLSKVRAVKLPAGKLCAMKLCGECMWLDFSQKRDDEFYCVKDKRYYSPTHSPFVCSEYKEKR